MLEIRQNPNTFSVGFYTLLSSGHGARLIRDINACTDFEMTEVKVHIFFIPAQWVLLYVPYNVHGVLRKQLVIGVGATWSRAILGKPLR